VIVPNSIKGGFVVGVRLGRGVMLLRDRTGAWQPPIFVSLAGGSVGWQAGLQATDVVLVFRTRGSVDGLLRGKLTLGVDAAAAAGPVGREAVASTDLALRAEILSYSRSRGLFLGVALNGSSLAGRQPGGTRLLRPAGSHTGRGFGCFGFRSSAVGSAADEPIGSLHGSRAGAGGETRLPATRLAAGSMDPGPAVATTGQQLADAARRLNALLDDGWQTYLAIPREVFLPDSPAHAEALAQTVRRFDGVLADSRYAELTRRPEFATVHRLLREYVSRLPRAPEKQLVLPPPPGVSGGGTSVGQGR